MKNGDEYKNYVGDFRNNHFEGQGVMESTNLEETVRYQG